MIPARGLSAWQSALCALVFIVAGLAVGWHSLDYEWHFDDLHLVRAYSGSEIAGAFAGRWDPDGAETKGLRPLTLLFNDARARVFGEWMVGHRVLLIVLFAGYLVGLASIARRFGAAWWVGLVAGVVTLCAKNSFYHFAWIADGIHLVPALFFVFATHALLNYLDGGRRTQAGLSSGLLLLALSAREDALALYGVVLLIGIAYLWFNDQPRTAYERIARYGVLLFCTFLPFWVWRLLVVPRAPNFRANLGVLTQPVTMFRWTISLSGQADAAANVFLLAFVILVAINLSLPRVERRRNLLWLVLAAVACLPGAVVARSNLLLFPISFYAIFVVSTMVAVSRTSRIATACVVGLLSLACIVSARASRLEQLSLHAMSADKIFHDWFGVYSQWRFASIPPERLQRTKASLARVGVVDESFDFKAWEAGLKERGRDRFIDDGEPFIPAPRFLSP